MTYDEMTAILENFKKACEDLETVPVELFNQATPDTATTMQCGLESLGKAFTNLLENPENSEYLDLFYSTLSRKMIGQLLLTAPITVMGSEIRLNKGLALEVAEELGPDWSQVWYRFIVLVTKLA